MQLVRLAALAAVAGTALGGNGSHAATDSLLWGTFRPNLYFGMRARLPHSVLTGLMWYGAHDYQSLSHTRHSCEQGDELASYGFTQHDGRSAAVQVIADAKNNVEITTRLLKVPGGDVGGSWAVRVSGRPLVNGEPSRITLINYFGNDGPVLLGDDGTTGFLEMETEMDNEGIAGTVRLHGSAQGLGKYTIRIENDPANQPLTTGPHAEDFGDSLERSHVYGGAVEPGQVWQAKTLIMNSIATSMEGILSRYGRESPPDPALLFILPNKVEPNSNLFAVQHTYEGFWSVDVFYDSASIPSTLDATSLTAGLAAASSAYLDRFSRTFAISSDEFDESQLEFARAITSNLVGGIGFFHGSSIVDDSFAQEWDDEDEYEGGRGKSADPRLTEPRELFTATPSRSFFPRGFYWDEGFHLRVIGAWDNDLSLEILKSWIDLIDENGWVAREQILGEEARSRVPAEFQTQYPSYANPPTLAMAVTAYIDRLKAAGVSLTSIDPSAVSSGDVSTSAESLASRHLHDPLLAQEFLVSIYPKLTRHYEWFRESQRGQIRDWGRDATSRTEAYRWRGRTADHVLTSGLDDYPRARPPHLGELHLDLMSWMGSFSQTMEDIAQFLGEVDDAAEYRGHHAAIVANLEDLHWSESEQMYCDASVDTNDDSIHVCHKGYISIFPLLLGLIPASSPHLSAVLDLMRDPEELWSPYGIRSLSKRDEYFGQGENYWRGPIWIQMNYLALSALHRIYAQQLGPNQVRAAEIYAELRTNVIKNVHSEYARTGYVWEQYDPITGEGKRSHPFTGWTSLVTLIMAEQY